ncbi:MAG: glycosyltransferase family 2 protein, partial [Paludibacteraceae bacterium]|nr:glycosyltransferase family 2 protein [Paludibacteraceae bacterium]
MFLWIFIVIFCIAYAFFSFLVIIGWKRIPQFKNGTTSHNTFISLIICCKNEEKHLPKLLESIRNQKYRNFELIIANDHSTDNSATILKQFTSPFATKIISTEKEG